MATVAEEEENMCRARAAYFCLLVRRLNFS